MDEQTSLSNDLRALARDALKSYSLSGGQVRRARLMVELPDDLLEEVACRLFDRSLQTQTVFEWLGGVCTERHLPGFSHTSFFEFARHLHRHGARLIGPAAGADDDASSRNAGKRDQKSDAGGAAAVQAQE